MKPHREIIHIHVVNHDALGVLPDAAAAAACSQPLSRLDTRIKLTEAYEATCARLHSHQRGTPLPQHPVRDNDRGCTESQSIILVLFFSITKAPLLQTRGQISRTSYKV